METPYNVLHIVATDKLNGAERIVQHICKHLNRDRFCPIIICAGEPLYSAYHQDGLVVEKVNVLRPSIENISKLRSVIKKNNINLIHAHDHRASLLAWLSTRFSGRLPIISHIHNTNPWLIKLHPLKLVEMLIRNRYDISIACSETVKNYFLQNNHLLSPYKIVTVSNSIEIMKKGQVNRKFILESLGIPTDSFVFGTVGRLHEQKGIDLLLIAFKEVAERIKETYLLIVGTGNEEIALKRLTEKLGLEKRVIFAGYREDIYEVFQIMNVFVMASRWEGLPMVLMEAMSYAIPVVVTNVGGASELVLDGETGKLISPGDVDALVSNMVFMYRQRERAEKMALAGQKLVEKNFNIVKQVKKIEKIYDSVLRGEG